MTWPPYRPPLTQGQNALRAATLLAVLLAIVATIAAWNLVAAALFLATAILLAISLWWEYTIRRHYRAQRRPFEDDADELLRQLFGDEPTQ